MKELTPEEKQHLENIKMWLDSMRDWIALSFADDDGIMTVDSTAPSWVRVATSRLDKSIYAPAHAALDEATLTPYRLGYALGLMKWGKTQMNAKIPPEVLKSVKRIRLAKRARRQMIRMVEDFLISIQIFARKNGRLQVGFQREIKMANSLARKYSGRDESDFHRGLSEGLRGMGRDVPGDRSTEATDVYILLVLWWRFIARFSSTTQLHNLIIRCIGPRRAGEKKRTEKICQRIGLKFRSRGRPRKNPTLAQPG